MTYQEYKSKYLGVKCGNTPQNMGECVGLVSLWMDNLNIPHEWGNAKDLLANANTQFVDVIYNDPKNLNQYPTQGDIMVFNATWGNGMGHTGIVDEATGKDFILFEQNNPAGNPPELIGHKSYSGVLGWLHPKSIPSGTFVDETTFINLVRKSTLYDKILDKLKVQDNETIVLQDIDKLIAYEDSLVQKDKQLSIAQIHANELDQALQVKEGELTTLQGQLQVLQDKTTTALEDNKTLSDEVAKLKENITQPTFTGWKQIIYKILQSI